MINHFQKNQHKNQEKLNKTPKDKIGVSAVRGKKRVKSPELEYRVDWFQGTFRSRYLLKVHKIISDLFGTGYDFEERSFGVRYFARSFRHPSGALSGVGHKIPGGKVNDSLAYVELSGDVIARIKQSDLKKLMSRLHEEKIGFTCTRIDLTIDDFGKSFKISQVKKALDDFHYVGFRNTGEYRQLGRKASRGHYVSFGNRGSKGGGKRIVFYDKSLESEGKIDSMRIELSCYDHYAQQSFTQLAELPYLCWGELIGAWISGAIDFRKRRGENDKNPGRRKRLAWWDRLVKNFSQLKASRDYKPDSLDKVKKWMTKQVAPSLAVLMTVMQENDCEQFWFFFWDLIEDGLKRFRDKHRYLVNSC